MSFVSLVQVLVLNPTFMVGFSVVVAALVVVVGLGLHPYLGGIAVVNPQRMPSSLSQYSAQVGLVDL